ncbi:MAG: penicillin-binding protein 2 [Campylobacterales bacterium]|nr:penicillin-binding protein 2 [Campylobacterales bacterium]
MKQESADKKKAKILLLFALITIAFVIFVAILLYWAQIDRKLPRLQTSESSTALRGDIISSDGFTIARSQKLYKAMVDTRNINKDKKDIFVKLYSLYSKDDPKRVENLITKYSGNVVLSYQINSKEAKHLEELASNLIRLGVFVSFEDPKSGLAYLRGLSIVESGESRTYPYKDLLSPIVGYVKKIEEGNITKVEGVKGVERYYQDYFKPIQDSLLIAPRDVANSSILNRYSKVKRRIDGYSAELSVSLKLQKMVEKIIDNYAKELNAKEIIVGVMDAKSSQMLLLASSRRFNPNKIERRDYPSLNASATEYVFEPGSVMKTIMFSLLLKEGQVNPYDLIRTYGGEYKLGKHTIKDTRKLEEWISAEDAIAYSSNVGSAQLAQKLDSIAFYQGLKDFGFASKSGIELPYENVGNIPSLQRFNSEIYKATVGYGYGMRANFMQILKAYNVFNNNGRLVQPKLVKNFIGNDGQKHQFEQEEPKQVITPAIAKRVKRVLIKAVQKGTGKNAYVEGLEIGGKTGTAHIAKDGGYANIYNGSFFGFVNDGKSSYTIGVLSREPKKAYHYFGSQSAAPIFKEVVNILVEEGYLTPQKN